MCVWKSDPLDLSFLTCEMGKIKVSTSQPAGKRNQCLAQNRLNKQKLPSPPIAQLEKLRATEVRRVCLRPWEVKGSAWGLPLP